MTDIAPIKASATGKRAARKPLKPISQQENKALYIQTSSLRDWSRSV